VVRDEGVEILLTQCGRPEPTRTPSAVRTVRAECLDWLLIVGRRHLEHVLRVYVRHYNEHRPHRTLKRQTRLPAGLTVVGEEQQGRVHRRDLLGDLLHEYRRVA
jgi:hypothetical protein